MTLTLQQKCDIANALREVADGYRRTAERLGDTAPMARDTFTAQAKRLAELAWDIGEAETVKIERKEK